MPGRAFESFSQAGFGGSDGAKAASRVNKFVGVPCDPAATGENVMLTIMTWLTQKDTKNRRQVTILKHRQVHRQRHIHRLITDVRDRNIETDTETETETPIKTHMLFVTVTALLLVFRTQCY